MHEGFDTLLEEQAIVPYKSGHMPRTSARLHWVSIL